MGFLLYPNGIPTRKYYLDGTVRCPKCSKGKYNRHDKKIYDSATCKKCGSKMVDVKSYTITSSGVCELKPI